MTLAKIMETLNIPEQTVLAIKRLPLPSNHKDLKVSFFMKTSLFREFAKNDANGLSVLWLYLHWLTDTKKWYDHIGIPEEFFWDSMKDIAIWCEDYLSRYQKPGFKEWEWVGRSLRLEVFLIGRLQFEPTSLKRPVTLEEKTYYYGTPALEVHIPAGEPLYMEEIMNSLSQAPEFFQNYFGNQYHLFHCHSWLLSPNLKNILPEDSRIVQFQNLFSIYKTDNEERQAEERIFGFLSDDLHDYPENTSLQKAVKSYMLTGKPVIMGSGVRQIKKVPLNDDQAGES